MLVNVGIPSKLAGLDNRVRTFFVNNEGLDSLAHVHYFVQRHISIHPLPPPSQTAEKPGDVGTCYSNVTVI